MKYILLITALILSTGCTDAFISKIDALGEAANISCWSGGELIYQGKSTGKVVSPENSDGYQFRDAETQKLTEVSGNCVITYGN